jgi:GDPmannose 4,6-dehydratase
LKKALITGVSGQDGAYLSDYLLSLGYLVYGAVRRTSNHNKERFNFFKLLENDHFKLIELDLTDYSSIQTFFKKYKVDEVYNLAAQSFVSLSFSQPQLTAQTNSIGVLNFLEAIKNMDSDKPKFYQASTSEMFGKVQEIPQNEKTPFYPRSPYGFAKLFAHWATINYRESYNLFAASGILFNHESPIRGHEFVTRKITSSIAKISKNKLDKLILGNMDAKRDWGFAGDYVKAMHLILQQKQPEDFVIATGQTNSVREFVSMAFKAVDIDIDFTGEGLSEKGYDNKTGKVIVEVSKDFYRPAEVDLVVGDPSKARKKMNWKPTTSLNDLITMMINYDLNIV